MAFIFLVFVKTYFFKIQNKTKNKWSSPKMRVVYRPWRRMRWPTFETLWSFSDSPRVIDAFLNLRITQSVVCLFVKMNKIKWTNIRTGLKYSCFQDKLWNCALTFDPLITSLIIQRRQHQLLCIVCFLSMLLILEEKYLIVFYMMQTPNTFIRFSPLIFWSETFYGRVLKFWSATFLCDEKWWG
jgi:hypothetical protein